MSNPSETLARVAGVHEAIGSSLGSFGGFIRCETCGSQAPMSGDRAGRYTRHGWPKCCGYTMRWWTQRQVDAGEVPA